tara:strand:+ start:1391 stop:2353 length:963 start_codon:yes stop_codon:yes gene_type:complete
MINIAFWSNQLGERGTEIAMYDYAYYNQTILKNKSYIFYEKNNENNNTEVINKFARYFQVVGVDDFSNVDNYLIDNKINIIYIIKSGHNDGRLSNVAKNIIHCVFTCNEPHGDVYCAVSDWVKNNKRECVDIKYILTLPHIVSLPEHNNNMRNELNIPDSAKVFGRHGGYNTFNINVVKDTVYEIALNNKDIYFLFLNTATFCKKIPNIIHLDTIIDLDDKRKFINTCDGMLWARSDGETFGLSIAEFSICNKPIIACKTGDLAHVEILKDKGMWYKNTQELKNLIINFEKHDNIDYNAYGEYTPDKIMKIFNKIILLLN